MICTVICQNITLCLVFPLKGLHFGLFLSVALDLLLLCVWLYYIFLIYNSVPFVSVDVNVFVTNLFVKFFPFLTYTTGDWIVTCFYWQPFFSYFHLQKMGMHCDLILFLALCLLFLVTGHGNVLWPILFITLSIVIPLTGHVISLWPVCVHNSLLHIKEVEYIVICFCS